MLKKGHIYLLGKPESDDEADLARPDYWDFIEFDQAPFFLQERVKINEQGKVVYKYIWGEWMMAGYIESIEHIVNECNVEEYEDRWKIAEEAWLKTIQLIIYQKLMKKIGEESK